ncbi:MAG: hypothetical protein A2Z76_04500 [Chloroflexi bacterium RBG_13_56_8b]|nr:MAG: hypothetical protein A2Z76_04500 [Chloroflexi bacterium RBG_13_56_8b]
MIRAATLAMLFIFVSNMLPAVLNHDSAAIDEAAGLTIEQLTTIATTAIEEQVKTAPIHSLIDSLTK